MIRAGHSSEVKQGSLLGIEQFIISGYITLKNVLMTCHVESSWSHDI